MLKRILLALALATLTLAPSLAQDKTEAKAVRDAVTLYASFDEEVKADFGGGDLTLSTRKGDLKTKKFTVEKGVSDKAFRIAKTKGKAGGALECIDVLPDNGRLFFPAKGNVAYKKGGWSGSVSTWIKTDPDKMLKTKFCDPVQITQKGANDGGIWYDFNDKKPRDMRMGVFPAVPKGEKGVTEDDPKAPMVWVRKVGFKADDWHHVVLTWKNFDSGRSGALATLYVDGKKIGDVKDRTIAMDWDVEKAGIYVAINFIGLLDEFAVFDRELSQEQVKLLYEQPGLLATLKKKKE
jgi:Concanavalin A-like lectin/glucanases superfamily